MKSFFTFVASRFPQNADEAADGAPVRLLADQRGVQYVNLSGSPDPGGGISEIDLTGNFDPNQAPIGHVKGLATAACNYVWDAGSGEWERWDGGTSIILPNLAPADNLANPATSLPVTSFNELYDGAGNWNRWSGVNGQQDGEDFGEASLGAVAAMGYVRDPVAGEWNRAIGIVTNSDNIAVSAIANVPVEAAFSYVFDGATWDRTRNSSAANISSTTQPFAQAVSTPCSWYVNTQTAPTVLGTVTKAAGGAGVRHVATGISAALSGAGGPLSQDCFLRDGASGVGTIMGRWVASQSIVGVGDGIAYELPNIYGSANTAMTFEFAGALAATFEAVSLFGWSTE